MAKKVVFMKKYALIFLTVFVHYGALALSFSDKISTDLSLYTFYADSTQVHSIKGGMRAGFFSNGEFNEYLKYEGKINLFFEEGSHRALNDDSFSKVQNFSLEKAFIDFIPSYFFNLKFGVFKSNEEYSHIFVATPELGLQEEIKVIDYNAFSLNLKSNQKIISSNSTENKTGTVAGETSYYLLHSASARYNHDIFNFSMTYGIYNYEGLGSSLANKAKYLGSTVFGSDSAAQFKYKFNGDFYLTHLHFNTIFDGLDLYYQYIHNDDAKKYGENIGAALAFYKIKIGLEKYLIQKDAILPMQIPNVYGRANMDGLKTDLSYHNQNYLVSLSYTTAKPIEKTLYQAQLSTLFLEFRQNFK